uniref:Uncharacterized protein n=1 Tax=Anguilla anguilla TaxID=7936 RepID=A0A0E9S7N7_ANGAN
MVISYITHCPSSSSKFTIM